MVPSIVYLDQADWAYLHAGRSPDAEAALRQCGANGGAIFLITVHHFEEGAGLTEPFERAAFLRGFPGTAFTSWSGYDLLGFEAEKLARGLPPETGRHIEMHRLEDISEVDLAKLTFGFNASHRLRKLLEPAYAHRRELFHLNQEALKARGARASRADDLALWRALIRGQTEEAIANWERVMRMKMNDKQRELMTRKASVMSTNASLSERLGFFPPRDLDFDDIFVRVVFMALPEDVRRDRDAVVVALKAWKDRSHIPSPLSCSAAVAAGVIRNPARAYEASEQVDALHVAFAAIVDLFTGDKRTVDALRQLKLPGRVLRTNKLADVAAALMDGDSTSNC